MISFSVVYQCQLCGLMNRSSLYAHREMHIDGLCQITENEKMKHEKADSSFVSDRISNVVSHHLVRLISDGILKTWGGKRKPWHASARSQRCWRSFIFLLSVSETPHEHLRGFRYSLFVPCPTETSTNLYVYRSDYRKAANGIFENSKSRTIGAIKQKRCVWSWLNTLVLF